MRISLDRLMLVCPHPDDETLGAGLLLQEASRYGARIRVVYLTDGERNPIPQFLAEGRWPRSAVDRERWGLRRRLEACSALQALGVGAGNAEFWGLPDQGGSAWASQASGRAAESVRAFAPTLLITPSPVDLHPDHAAAAMLFAGVDRPLAHFVYRVHGALASFGDALLPPSDERRQTQKLAAIAKHETQIAVSRARLRRLALRPEAFWSFETEAGRSDVRWRALRRLVHLFPFGHTAPGPFVALGVPTED